MIKIERHNKILHYLNVNGSLSISKISKELKCSEETVRKDLVELERESKLIRIHGGAYIEDRYDKGFSSNIRETLLKEEKMYISDIALDFVKDRNTLMLDSSTTCIEFAKKILNSKIYVTIITNSLQIANLCDFSENAKLILLGGKFRTRNKSFTGYHTTDILKLYNADISFVSYPSIDIKLGLGDNNYEELRVRETMLKHSKVKILLMDHTKFSENASIVFSKISNINCIITDKKINKKWEEFFKREDINVKF